MKRLILLVTTTVLLLNGHSQRAQSASGCVDYERYPHWEGGSNWVFDDLAAGQWYLYGTNFWDLHVFDTHGPGPPKHIGSVSTFVSDGHLAISGQTVYLAGGSVMKLVNVSQPTSPTVVGSVNIPDVADEIAVAGSYVYIATGWNSPIRSSLQIVDVSNPTAPAIAGHFDFNIGPIGALDVSGSYAYVGLDNILFVFNVSNPSQPALVGGLNLAGDCQAIRVLGTHVNALTSTTLQVIDISQPTSPVAISAVPVGGRDLAITGSLACVLGTSVVNVVDISAPAAPIMRATIDVQAYNDPVTIAASGSHAYVATDRETLETGHATLHTISLSAISPPAPVGILPGVSGKVAVEGSHAYVLSLSELRVIDVSNPSVPTVVGSTSLPSDCKAISVVGSHAYIAVANPYPAPGGTMKVVDVSNPSAPSVVGSVNIDSPCDIAAKGSYAFIGDDTGLKIIDVSTPSAPTITRQFPFGPVQIMTLGTDSRVYLYTPGSFPSNEHLWVINVYEPQFPTFVWEQEDVVYVTGIAVVGSFLYTCVQHPDNIPIIYVSEWSTPDGPLTGVSQLFPLRSGQLTAADGLAYLTLQGGTLAHLIDDATSAHPGFAGDVTFCGSNVAVAGGYLYTAPGDFYVLHAQCAQHTTAVEDAPRTAAFSVETFPNPFNPTTRIEYEVPSAGVVTVCVYDVQGGKVALIVDHQRQTAGDHNVIWNGSTDQGVAAASGVYFVVVEQHGNTVTKKITLLK